MNHDWKSVPLPHRMASLPKDRRGYPIPFIVTVDPDGKPHFTINDRQRIMQCYREDRCAICGQKNLRGRWFVGGPLSALSDRGAYLDPPGHKECLTYALQVCPFLAAPNYTKRIDAGTFDAEKFGDQIALAQYDEARPEQPDLFLMVMGIGNDYARPDPVTTLVWPKGRRIVNIEYWRHGEKLSEEEGRRLAAQALEEETCQATR